MKRICSLCISTAQKNDKFNPTGQKMCSAIQSHKSYTIDMNNLIQPYILFHSTWIITTMCSIEKIYIIDTSVIKSFNSYSEVQSQRWPEAYLSFAFLWTWCTHFVIKQNQLDWKTSAITSLPIMRLYYLMILILFEKYTYYHLVTVPLPKKESSWDNHDIAWHSLACENKGEAKSDKNRRSFAHLLIKHTVSM